MMDRHTYGIVCIVFGVLALIIPQGWDTAPAAKIIVAALFIGIGVAARKR